MLNVNIILIIIFFKDIVSLSPSILTLNLYIEHVFGKNLMETDFIMFMKLFHRHIFLKDIIHVTTP